MCTAITLKTSDHYFGRNLDIEYSYHETVTITPRNYPLYFRKAFSFPTHHAIIGMAYVNNDYPLYYDAINEMGLSMAGLNFPEYAVYQPAKSDKNNIAPFEFIPWVLGQCSSLAEAKSLLEKTNVIKEDYSHSLPLTPLHWIISDKTCSIVAEPLAEGLKIYDNPIGVLTNSPSFDMQLKELSSSSHFGDFHTQQPHILYARQQFLPGDWSSMSRFIKAAFVKQHSICNTDEHSSVNQFFHLLDSVAFVKGCRIKNENNYEVTVYSSCCNTEKGIYYYKTYNNTQINGIDLFLEDLEQNSLISYPLLQKNSFPLQNSKANIS